jgi:HlyD family secretion protein
MSSTTTENVVTYPVVVSAANPELKLMPGMTADVSFQVGVAEDVLKIPNAALRFYPNEEEWVHPDDRDILRGKRTDDVSIDQRTSARDMAESSRSRNRRHVWIQDGRYLRAVEVEVGMMETGYTALVSGDIREGQQLVTDIDYQAS